MEEFLNEERVHSFFLQNFLQFKGGLRYVRGSLGVTVEVPAYVNVHFHKFNTS
jgi:hypothetical protein